jgi:hypothetical protein
MRTEIPLYDYLKGKCVLAAGILIADIQGLILNLILN